VNFINHNHDKPFFLYFSLTSPHTPVAPNKQWRGKSGLSLYADFVMETDAMIGKVLQALQDNGVAENTLVFITSDNGALPGDKYPAFVADVAEDDVPHGSRMGPHGPKSVEVGEDGVRSALHAGRDLLPRLEGHRVLGRLLSRRRAGVTVRARGKEGEAEDRERREGAHER